MRYIKILLVAFCVLGLSLGAAEAGLNPQDPGLAGGLAVYNPNLSRICTDCHSAVPSSEAMNGSHFAFNVGAPAVTTRSGGGWTGSLNGIRTGGQYFKASRWGTGAWRTYSKYGNTADNTNRYTALATDNAGMGTTTAIGAAYAGYQIICESCHSLVLNVAGGNNLVAPMTAVYASGVGSAAQTNPWSNGEEATLCVGCHGFMYTTNASNTAARYADTRNNHELGSGLRGNNHFHYISGTQYAQNHHVMTSDLIDSTLAGAGLLWRDVFVVPPDAAGTFDSGSNRGQMPQRATWITDGGKAKAATTVNFNCVHCHSAPHTGDLSTGASILRDTNAGGGTPGAMARIGEAGRTWMGFSDVNYCNDCHVLK